MRQSLPGIKFIGYLPCSLLPPNILQKSLVGVPVAIYSPPTPVEYYGNAECVAEQEYDHGSYLEKTTLTFTTTDEIPANKPIAFIITDVTGQSYAIGTNEPPYTVVAITRKNGEEIAFFEVEIFFFCKKILISLFFLKNTSTFVVKTAYHYERHNTKSFETTWY